MIWWEAVLVMLSGGFLVFLGFWAASRVAKGEPMIPKRPRPAPKPTYEPDEPFDRREAAGMGVREFEDVSQQKR